MNDPPPSIIKFLFADAFHWTPEQVEAMDLQTFRDFQTILSLRNQLRSND